MCERFINNFVDKVSEKVGYLKCEGGYYKLFDEKLLKFIGRITYRIDIDDRFYIDLAIYYLHRGNITNFVDILRILHINTGNRIIKIISNEIKEKHINCVPEENNNVVFASYNGISWNELSYMNAEDKNKFFGEKQSLKFNEWLKIFLKEY